MDENLVSRSMPHDIQSEQALLVAMFRNSACISQVMTAIKPDDFYLDINRDLYTTIFHMVNTGNSVHNLAVRDELLRSGKYTQEQLNQYIEDLYRDTVSAANVQTSIDILQDKSLLRRIAQTAAELTQVIQDGTETGSDLLELAEQRIHSLRQGRNAGGLVHISLVLQDVYAILDERYQNGGKMAGISSGFTDLDTMISGLNKSDLILLAARPAMGKTTFALNILLEAAKKSGKTVAFFSLEMSTQQLGMRLIASESFVDNKHLQTGQLNDQEWEAISLACDSLISTNIVVNDDSAITVADIKSRCRREEDLGLIVIDYLQLMSSAGGRQGGGNRQEVVSDISRALKIMAKELQVPVLCLSQLSRASEKRESKRPVMSDLRDSGAIEQDADIVMFLYREDYYDQESENHNIAQLIVAKNRHGETGDVELGWLPQYSAFQNLSRTGPQAPPY